MLSALQFPFEKQFLQFKFPIAGACIQQQFQTRLTAVVKILAIWPRPMGQSKNARFHCESVAVQRETLGPAPIA
jgi:hypothetical protein